LFRNKNNNLQYLRKLSMSIEVQKFNFDLQDKLRNEMGIFNLSIAVAATYMLYLLKEKNIEENAEFEKALDLVKNDENIYFFIKEKLKNSWENVAHLLNEYDNEIFKAYILFFDIFFDKADNSYREFNVTPKSIVALSLRLLDIKEDEHVADFGTGFGTFIRDAYLDYPYARYYGNELNTNAKIIAYIRAKLLSENIEIEQNDMFNIENIKFDKIFSNYPFSQRLTTMKSAEKYYEELKKVIGAKTKTISSDWIYNYLIVSRLKIDGKAVGIMTFGSTWNSLDRAFREYFVRKGLIECVISLPRKMYDYTAIPTVAVVLSHGNKVVRLIDASDICHKGRRENSLTNENIDSIVQAIYKDTSYSKTVSVEILEKNDFVINPARYLTETIPMKNAVYFGDLIKSITRGAPCTAAELDKLESKEPTEMKYLMLANIKDGFIDEELPYLKEIPKNYEKYCLKNKNLLLSKNGAPFKVAIADIGTEEKILANGNLYVIALDESKVNPYYIKAFFESEDGIAALSRIAVGAAIPNISQEQLRRLQIPIISLEKQNKIATEYLAKVDEIALLKLKLTKATSALKNIFSKED